MKEIKGTLEEFYNAILGIESPWEVVSISKDRETQIVTASVHFKQGYPLVCPECGLKGKLHDHRKRKWRHLDSCNHKTHIQAGTQIYKIFV